MLNDKIAGEFARQVYPALENQGIDWRTWQPTPPFRIAGHEATFNPDGSIKVGCATVSSEEFREISKRQSESLAQAAQKASPQPDGCNAEPASEYPKYWFSRFCFGIWRAASPNDTGRHFDAGGDYQANGCPILKWAAVMSLPSAPRAIAEAHIAAWASARQPKEQAWPQYFKGYGGSAVLRFNNPDESGTFFEPGKMPRAWTGCAGSAYRLASSGGERGYVPMTIPEAEHMIANLWNK